MDTLRVGIVGTGMMGCEHICNLRLIDGVRVVALADPVATSLNAAMGLLGADGAVQRFSSSEELARHGSLDVAIVASPNFTHRAALEPLFDAGLHILCEKPLCTTVEDARWVVARAARHPQVFWTAMEYRFMPPVARFIEDLAEGKVGRLIQLSLREHRFPFLPKVGNWNRFSRNTGGTLVEKCCHFFDLMRLVARANPVRVFCSAGMDVNHLDERYDGERPDILDNAFTVVDFDNGVRALLDLSMFAEGSEEQETFTAVGDRGKLEVFIPSGTLVHSPRVPWLAPKRVTREHVAVDAQVLAAGTHHGSVYYQLQAFFAAVRGLAKVKVSAEDGLYAVAMGVAAETSAREKRVVDMAELQLT